jgi:hypothetical protein
VIAAGIEKLEKWSSRIGDYSGSEQGTGRIYPPRYE